MNEEKNIINALMMVSMEDVTSLDQQVMDGKGLAYYETAMVSGAAFFRNRILGTVGDMLETFQVHITFHETEVAASCNCSRSRKLCKHIIALLYAWVNDRDEFLDVEKVMGRIREMDKIDLLKIVENIIYHHPEFTELFLSKRIEDWDEIEPLI